LAMIGPLFLGLMISSLGPPATSAPASLGMYKTSLFSL
jgi:hypothetical protein